MRRGLALLALIMGLAACGGSSRRASVSALATSSPEADLGLDELRKSLESTVLENYAQLSYGNIEAFVDGVARDIALQLVGITPKDVLVGVDPAGLGKDRRLYRHRIADGLRILSKNLDVHLSADGSVGWIYDEMSYRVMYMGREASIPIRVTGTYVRDVERWVLVAEHMSYGLAIDGILTMKARGELVAGKRFKSTYASSRKLSAQLVGLVRRFANGAESAVPTRGVPEALVLLPASEQEFHGEDLLAAPSLAELFGKAAIVAVRDFRIQVAPSKRVAWMITNLSVQADRNGDSVEIPLRGSFVLERREDQTWEIMQAHVSAPLREPQLSERVFGPND